MDADGAIDERLPRRTAKSCGSDASIAGVKLAMSCNTTGDGDKKARSPGRVRRKPLKPLRAGMPGDPGGPVVTMLVCFSNFACEAAGASSTRHSPRPLNSRWLHVRQNLRAPRGEIVGVAIVPGWRFAPSGLRLPKTSNVQNAVYPPSITNSPRCDMTKPCSSDRPRCRRNRWARQSGASGFAASRWRRIFRWP